MDIVLGAVERAQVDCKNVSIQKNIMAISGVEGGNF